MGTQVFMDTQTILKLTTGVGIWNVVAHSDGRLEVIAFEAIEIVNADEPHTIEDASFRKPEQSLIAKAASWAMAEASLVMQGALDGDALAQRLSECGKCDQLQSLPLPQVGHCRACGCGRNARSELSVKATMPAAGCPLGKWAV